VTADDGPRESPTPILDRLTPLPPQESIMRPRVAVLWIAVGFVLGMALLSGGAEPFLRSRIFRERAASVRVALSDVSILELVMSALAVMVAAIAVHEAGHACFGWLAGFRVDSIRIGRIQLDLPFRVSLYRGSGTGSGGWVRALPVRRDKLALRAVVMVLGGPASNLMSAAVVLALPFTMGLMSGLFVLVSTAIGVINLLPFRRRAVLSDGRRVLMLLRNRAHGERWLALMKLVSDLADGIPPESLSPHYLALATAVRDNTSDTVSAHVLAYGAAFHQHRDDEAGRLLEIGLRYSTYAPPILRQALMAEAAVFQGRRRQRADLAAEWVADMPAKTEIPWLRRWSEAAILEARGDVDGALVNLEEVATMIRAGSSRAQRDISLRSLHRWQTELGSDRGQTGVRPGSDRGQTTL
jgi:hypothetical protein